MAMALRPPYSQGKQSWRKEGKEEGWGAAQGQGKRTYKMTLRVGKRLSNYTLKLVESDQKTTQKNINWTKPQHRDLSNAHFFLFFIHGQRFLKENVQLPSGSPMLKGKLSCICQGSDTSPFLLWDQQTAPADGAVSFPLHKWCLLSAKPFCIQSPAARMGDCWPGWSFLHRAVGTRVYLQGYDLWSVRMKRFPFFVWHVKVSTLAGTPILNNAHIKSS